MGPDPNTVSPTAAAVEARKADESNSLAEALGCWLELVSVTGSAANNIFFDAEKLSYEK